MTKQEETGTKRVVSKQTKLLFIAFGAAGIAIVCLVYGADFGQDASQPTRAPQAARVVSSAKTAH